MKRLVTAFLLLLLAFGAGLLVPSQGIVWETLNQEVISLYQQGRYDRAFVVVEKELQVAEQAVGSNHPSVAMSLNNLSLLHRNQNQCAQAEPLYKRALAIREKGLRPNHSDMGGPQIEFVWPGLIGAIPFLLIAVIIPAQLIFLVFKYSRISNLKKCLLVPVCIVIPLIVSSLLPLALKLSGIVGFTGSRDYQPPYTWYATEMFGEYTDYVWVIITTLSAVVTHRMVKCRQSANPLSGSFSPLKYVLIPLTMFLWYLTTYYGLYLAVIGMAFMFSLGWLWLIMGYLFLVGTIFGISNAIPGLLRILILKIYGINWFSCIVHSLAGVTGVVVFFGANPPELVIGDESYFIITGMWKISPVKTVFLASPFVGFVVSLLWSTIIFPVYIKLLGKKTIMDIANE